jgi:hypothetical protein
MSSEISQTTPLGVSAEAALTRALRDIADGHLTVWRSLEGIDRADRQLAGAPARWWEILAARGEYLPPTTVSGPWRLRTPDPSR